MDKIDLEKDLFGEMRNANEEEKQAFSETLERLSSPAPENIFDIYDDPPLQNCVKETKYFKLIPIEYQKAKPTDKYRYCNHHHELDDEHELVDFGNGEFVANKQAIPLLKALNEIGLKTRSHHIADEPFAWVCILMDNITDIHIKDVYEADADRTKYNGKKEVLIEWKK